LHLVFIVNFLIFNFYKSSTLVGCEMFETFFVGRHAGKFENHSIN